MHQNTKMHTSWSPYRTSSHTPPRWVERRHLHHCHQEASVAKMDAESWSNVWLRRRPPLCSTRCWWDPTTTSGLCWCASTCKRKDCGTPSRRRKEKRSSTGRIDWRWPPYCWLCLRRCWRLSPPSALHNQPRRGSNPVGLVCCECGSPTSSSCGRSSQRFASRMTNPLMIFHEDHEVRQQHHHSQWEH